MEFRRVLFRSAMKLRASGLGYDIDDGAEGLLELRSSERGLDSELFNGFHQRDDGNSANILVRIVTAIDNIGVFIRPRSVDGRIEGDGPAIPLLVVINIVRESAKLARNGALGARHQGNDVASQQRQRLEEIRA